MDGVLLINKPQGPTSHDIVARIRRLAGTKRVGHAGTLDPNATGLLLCCVGRATRIVPYLVGMNKEYTGEMTLGAVSDTYDIQGKLTPIREPIDVDLDSLREAFHHQTGIIEQEAPPYSAVRVQGKRLYEYARKNQEVPKKVRSVWVERFDPVRYLPPAVTFIARVGSGTYIRSLAHAVGQELGCGAYLSQLCRTQVGGFSLDNALSMENLEMDPELLLEAMLSIPEALVHLPKMVLLPAAELRLRYGNEFTVADIQELEGPQPVREPVLVLSSNGDALAIVRTESEDAPYRPLCVFVTE